MNAVASESATMGERQAGTGGLFRTALAGPGRTLTEAFANLERSPQVEQMARHPGRDLLGARMALAPEEGEGYWELVRIRNDLYVIIENFAYKHPRTELVPGDGLIQFNFKVSGDMTLDVERPDPLRFNRPSLLVWAQPAGIDMSEWTAPSAHERNVAISVRPEFLVEQFLTSIVDLPRPLQAFVANDRETITYYQIPMSAQMFEAAMRLINNSFSGALALVYAEALALELLCMAFGAFRSMAQTPTGEYSERELRCLHVARSILMRQFAPPPTIAQLARSVGMAESHLMKSFKVVFGETVFDFSLRCRMQHALMLLRDQHQSVSVASEAVGYGHSTSFATAFRRHFGIRPIDVRRSRCKTG